MNEHRSTSSSTYFCFQWTRIS